MFGWKTTFPGGRAYLMGVATAALSRWLCADRPTGGRYEHRGDDAQSTRTRRWNFDADGRILVLRLATTPQITHAFYYSVDGGTVALNTLNGTFGLPMGINNNDQVVGESYTSDGSIHGFITRPGAPAVDLNDLIAPGSGYAIVAGLSINDQGYIRAMGKDAVGMNHFMVLYPISGVDPNFPALQGQGPPPISTDPAPPQNVPEPSTLVVFAIAGSACLARRRRWRLHSS